MRDACRRVRIDTHHPSPIWQLKRSPTMFRHLRNEGSSVGRAELRDRDKRCMLCVLPSIRAVQSQRCSHHLHSALFNGQHKYRERVRAMRESKCERVQLPPGCSARSDLASTCQRNVPLRCGHAHWRFRPPPWPKPGVRGNGKKYLPVPYHPLPGAGFGLR